VYHNRSIVCSLCVCGKIYNEPLLEPKQSRVHVRRPNRRDVSLAATDKRPIGTVLSFDGDKDDRAELENY